MLHISLRYFFRIAFLASACLTNVPDFCWAKEAQITLEKENETTAATDHSLLLGAAEPMNEIYHPVSTANPNAQTSFNRGLTYIFAYNHDLAFKEFEKASKSDPTLAMAYWGMALALGQNINQDITPENEVKAYDYCQKALTLSSKASPVEQAYIKALVERYTNDPANNLISLRFNYRNAMKKLSVDYPEDLDAACLYAESILDLDPWKYWTWDGKPKEGTYEAIDVLESVLKRNPNHIGANHYYIHAWEESPMPERALMSAFRLTRLLPESGHLLHMPCHIFILCGYYHQAIETNKRAIAADRRYIQENGMGGEYPLHYLSHNMKVQIRSYMLLEDYENAIREAEELNQYLKSYYQQMPNLARFMTASMEVNLYFHRWKEILALPTPTVNFPFTQAYWHFGRAMASLKLGDIDAYRKERALMIDLKGKINPNEEISNNPAINILDLGELQLDVAVAKFENNQSAYFEKLNEAIDKQDRLYYDEPPAWYVLSRIELGKALLEQKRFVDAEKVFKKSLDELQRNGRLLFGLQLSLKGQERNWDAYWVEREMHAALKYATQQLTLENL